MTRAKKVMILLTTRSILSLQIPLEHFQQPICNTDEAYVNLKTRQPSRVFVQGENCEQRLCIILFLFLLSISQTKRI